jgi:hypothetical protein
MTKLAINAATGESEVLAFSEADKAANDKIEAAWPALRLEKDALKFQEERKTAYGTIGDQLDMQYHDLVDSTTTWKDHIAKVKSDNAKP